jgi:signal transduction histidine kinase
MHTRVLASFALLAVMSGPAMAEDMVLLHAAGSLRFALTDIAKSFEAAGGVKVQAKFGASGLLKDEIADGAKAEVFASANMETRKPLGLIVYELITNAVRHAFHGRNGEIRVELLRAGVFVRCKVMDNGSAPAHVQRGHGLRIIEELIKALDGRFEQRFGTAGSTSILVFPYKSGAITQPADTADNCK